MDTDLWQWCAPIARGGRQPEKPAKAASTPTESADDQAAFSAETDRQPL